MSLLRIGAVIGTVNEMVKAIAKVQSLKANGVHASTRAAMVDFKAVGF